MGPECSWAAWKGEEGRGAGFTFRRQINRKGYATKEEDFGSTAPVRNLLALLERYPARPAVKMKLVNSWSVAGSPASPGPAVPTPAALAPSAPEARGPEGRRQELSAVSAGEAGDRWPLTGLRHPLPLQAREQRGGGRTGALTFPGAAVRGSAPLQEKARSVELGLRGQDRAGHSILVQPKATAASSLGRTRLLCGLLRGEACVLAKLGVG